MLNHWGPEAHPLSDTTARANDERANCRRLSLPPAEAVLQARSCGSCSAVLYAARGACSECGSRLGGARRELSGKGVIYSYTRHEIRPVEPGGAKERILVMVRSEEGPLVTGELRRLGRATPQIGMSVVLVKVEDGAVGWAFQVQPPAAADGVES